MISNDAILHMLTQNMGYKPEEEIVILTQDWTEEFGEDTKWRFEDTQTCARKIQEVFAENNIPCRFITYIPVQKGPAINPPADIAEIIGTPGIVFMITAYSLSWTSFRKQLSKTGTRVASMPGFSLDMFNMHGPMDVDFETIESYTTSMFDKLKKASYVHITGKGTDITIQVNKQLVHASSGDLSFKGAFGNLPGAETYCIPLFEGNSNGYFTVPKGWGGMKALECDVTFHIENGRFTKAIAIDPARQSYVEKEVHPILFGQKNFDVLAELGIGTNPNVTPAYIKEHGWSTLLAEKIFGSAHFANGNSAGMGGENDVPMHQDWVVPNVDIEFRSEE